MGYKFFDNIAVADVAYEAGGKTMEEMFESAANALMTTQVKDLETVKKKEKVTFKLENKDEERLLHDFLQELIFYKDAKLLLFSRYKLKITRQSSGGFKLEATCFGEELNMKKHELLVDVKAVSWHMFKVWQDEKKKEWKCFIILDV